MDNVKKGLRNNHIHIILLVSTDLGVELLKVRGGNGKRMFDGDASDVVEHS